MTQDTKYLKGQSNACDVGTDYITTNEIPELRNWIIAGIGSYGVKMSSKRALAASYTNRMDFIGCYIADYEKIKLEPINPIIHGPIGSRINRGNAPHFKSWQLNLDQMGMGGDINNACNNLDESAKIVKIIVDQIEDDSAKYGSHIGLYEYYNSRCGGTGTTVGVLMNGMLKMNQLVDIDKIIETTVIPREDDGVKLENRKITLASQLKMGLPGKDLVFLVDNSTVRHGNTREDLDRMNAILLEALRSGEPIKGDNDISDRICTLKDEGNRFVLPAAMVKNLPIQEKGWVRKKKQLNEMVLRDSLNRNLSDLCSENGFQRYGFVRARKTKPVFLVICGSLPENVISELATSTAIPNHVSILYLHTNSLKYRMLLGALHVTDHSIDSIDRIYGTELNGVRSAQSPEKLLPDDLLEDYSTMAFPRSTITYPEVYKRVARICNCSPEEIMEVA